MRPTKIQWSWEGALDSALQAIFALMRKYRQFILYSIIGVSGATLDFVVFWGLVYPLAMDKFLANAISVSLGITNNFLLNAFLNFRKRDEILRRFVLFYAVGIFGLGLSSLILMIFVDWFHLHVGAVKFVSIFVVVLVQFNLNKRLAFGTKRGP